MNYENILTQEEVREENPNCEERVISDSILDEYTKINSSHSLPHESTGDPLEDLLYNYFLIKGTKNEKLITKLLELNGFKYSNSIHNAIYYLLGKKEELAPLKINPLLWPGIKSIASLNNAYTLNTKLGIVKVAKANKIFENTNSSYIFNLPLMGNCFSRTYDFLRENPKEYKAVLSYQPNFFCEGYYHAYLENDTHVLDIASNAYYLKEEAMKVLCGDIITKLTYEEVEEQSKKLQEEIPEVIEKPKLKILTLYHDIKKSNLID